jgi:hypothetical protein
LGWDGGPSVVLVIGVRCLLAMRTLQQGWKLWRWAKRLLLSELAGPGIAALLEWHGSAVRSGTRSRLWWVSAWV